MKLNTTAIASTVVGGVLAAIVVAAIARNTNLLAREKPQPEQQESGWFW